MTNIGDKFIITIGDKAENEQSGETLYRIKGFKSLVFDENGINKLEKYDEKGTQEIIDAYTKKIKVLEGKLRTIKDNMITLEQGIKELQRGEENG